MNVSKWVLHLVFCIFFSLFFVCFFFFFSSRRRHTRWNCDWSSDVCSSDLCYAYDTVRNLETVRVEGLPSTTTCTQVTVIGATLPLGNRKISTAWHPRWRSEERRVGKECRSRWSPDQ